MHIFELKMTAGEGYSNPYYFIDGKRVPEWVYHDKSRRCVRFDCFHTERYVIGQHWLSMYAPYTKPATF